MAKALRYVGKNERYGDPLYGTNLIWQKGETLEVPDDKAPLLLRHPDVWELDEEAQAELDAHRAAAPSLSRSRGKKALPVDVPVTDASQGQDASVNAHMRAEEDGDFRYTAPLADMTKAQIMQHVFINFGKEMDANKSKDDLVTEARDFMLMQQRLEMAGADGGGR